MASSQRREDEPKLPNYPQLKDLTIRLDRATVTEGARERRGSAVFSLSLWVYLSSSVRPWSIILWQVLSEKDGAPFLALNGENRLTLFPLMLLHKEAPSPFKSFPWTDISHISADFQCPMEKWVHVGCEVAANYMCLHVDGTLTGEKQLSFLLDARTSDIYKSITLVGNDRKDGKLDGYVYDVRVLSPSASLNDQLVKDPPMKLALGSCIFDGVEAVGGGGGVWGIVGGKASCCHNFTVEVILLNALGLPVHQEMEIVASLLYVDNGTPVEKTKDKTEVPLLISCDGLDFLSIDKLVRLHRGRAIFKLKMLQEATTYHTGSELKSNNVEGTDSASSTSDSTDARNSESLWINQTNFPISDMIIFKYCLADTHERARLLKEIVASSASNRDIENFASQVSLYAGCSHHRHQIMMSRQLIQDGADTWKLISHNSDHPIWTKAVPEIVKKFMKIANCARGLSQKDLEILQGIGLCDRDLGRENFDRLWYWLYPVSLSLSESHINAVWNSLSPKWIEGFITAEEAEYSLRGPEGLKKPGTFVLRFPTSRSWPHPDAGSLVVSYVGGDSTLHHRLLSPHFSSGENAKGNQKLMQTLLLEQPELSQLGSITREGMLRPQYVL